MQVVHEQVNLKFNPNLSSKRGVAVLTPIKQGLAAALVESIKLKLAITSPCLYPSTVGPLLLTFIIQPLQQQLFSQVDFVQQSDFFANSIGSPPR